MPDPLQTQSHRRSRHDGPGAKKYGRCGALASIVARVRVRVSRTGDNGNLEHQGTDEATMTRAQVLQQLAASKAELATRFGVTGLALFGSVVRDAARADSDVDVLVSFDGPATSARYFGVQFFLEDLLGRPVDLVTNKALRPALRPYVEREAVHV
jgi:predicted nucleotidyltransferase